MITLFNFFLFPIVNIILGLIPLFLIVWFLFYPNRKRYIFDKHIPLTPAYAYRKKKQLIAKLHRYLYDYLKDCKNSDDETRVVQWETKAYQKAFERFTFIAEARWIPNFISERIQSFLAKIVYEIVRQFLRKLVPYLMDRYELSSYIELLNQKLDVNVIRDFIMKKILKYIVIFLVAFYGLIGLTNGILYLIIK